ncbi:enoyl-CoA hydratase [Crenobacter caeni]|uniref:Enoyl-CoA hydratase n=1 Tax=Crenobacter caeni TaxID=2705474 RepID=A0A6B2KQX1_9NEIS|nr:enoyl-CoA hydratase [Crenobacter caeni]NDV12451.1 enoyl-CoA hydratase [Crenobacter caeni]
MKPVVVEKLGSTAIVTIAHTPVNTLSEQVLLEIEQTVGQLALDEHVRAIVLTGAGEQYFCAGIDMTMFVSGDKAHAAEVVDAFRRAQGAIKSFAGVTIAAINGYALGGGLELALSCDYMVAERGAVLGMPEASAGLVPFGGGSKSLAQKVGLAWAKRMMLGGETLDAGKAYDIGLIEEVVEPGFSKIVAVSLAGKVARQGEQAVILTRKLIDDSLSRDMDAQLAAEKLAFVSLVGSAEQLEGVHAFLEKRSPSWVVEDED